MVITFEIGAKVLIGHLKASFGLGKCLFYWHKMSLVSGGSGDLFGMAQVFLIKIRTHPLLLCSIFSSLLSTPVNTILMTAHGVS